jgi:hypothetical protein
MGLMSFVTRVGVPDDHAVTKQEELNAAKRRIEFLRAHSELLGVRLNNYLESREGERAGDA